MVFTGQFEFLQTAQTSRIRIVSFSAVPPRPMLLEHMATHGWHVKLFLLVRNLGIFRE